MYISTALVDLQRFLQPKRSFKAEASAKSSTKVCMGFHKVPMCETKNWLVEKSRHRLDHRAYTYKAYGYGNPYPK